jgi:hypothetical protein
MRGLDLSQKGVAGDEARTRDIQLGRLTLYQLSYSRLVVLVVDGEGFEPSKRARGGFTVRSLWPLGHPSVVATAKQVELTEGVEPTTA